MCGIVAIALPEALGHEAAAMAALGLFALQHRGQESAGVAVSDGEQLMVYKDLGLVSHEPYHGVTLTASGERVALEVIRHHRLIEAYLAEALGMPWDRVHDEAEVLEHYISEELEERLATALGDPSHDPHGDPIPDRDLELGGDEGVALASLEPGDGGTFSRVSDSDPEMLRYLADRGIKPGASLSVRERQPFGGPVFVEVGGDEHAIGGELAERMLISAE